MLTSELNYRLPEDLIAQKPATPRDSSRLMVIDVRKGTFEHCIFRELPRFLLPGDALVLNETKVLPARLFARRPGEGGMELLFLRDLGTEDGAWEVMARPSKRLRAGMTLSIGEDKLRVLQPLGEGRWGISSADVLGLLKRYGRTPLPPYIRATPEAEKAYQTVYAQKPGSAAAPTAGLHFSREVLVEVERAGARISRVTLHVGRDTFSPVRTERLVDHRMCAEHYCIPDEAAEIIDRAERVVAVGTTVTRALESWVATGSQEGASELFILPGYRWGIVDVLLTNFHLPRSTLLAMVMAFAGKELIREAYEAAVKERYRFFSFGDAMLLVGGAPR
ncbi:MAG: tRNA preQ1(34) S-adenosylmethionine ribosyltransferase-isomerase QueA [Rubrobacter sp.]|nr:tRNA preQ1(34) S-adenosylmethionine ribosyltransferase-isomerase QueA [Rubrobacter sp.]